MKRFLFCAVTAMMIFSRPTVALSPVPPPESWGLTFMARPEVNDLLATYSFNERFALGFHGIRNHWPKEVELHYGIIQLNSRLFTLNREAGRFDFFGLVGLGWANKLKGFDRMASLLGMEVEYKTKKTYSSLRANTIRANGFDQKNFIRARTGFSLYEAEPNTLKTMVLLHALYENHAEHTLEYGPVLSLQYKNVGTEFYGNFKGAFSWDFSFYY